MIQRIQTVWLFLAALAGAGLFYFNVHKAVVIKENAEVVEKLGAGNNFILLLLALVLIVLPLVAIFMFKNRKSQKRMAMLGIVANAGFLAAAIMLIGNITNKVPAPKDSSYLPGIVLPIVCIVFITLAIRGINKDEKLIRSQDRLR